MWAVGLSAVFLLITLVFRLKFFLTSLTLFVFTSAMFYGFGNFAFFPENHLLNTPSTQINAVKGVITDVQHSKNGRGRYLLQCQAARFKGKFRKVQGKVLLFQTKGEKCLAYGDQVLVNARLQQPPLPRNPGDFNYRRYLNFNKIFFTARFDEDSLRLLKRNQGNVFLSRVIFPLRQKIRSVFERYFSQPARGVLKALILGERNDLQKVVLERFQKTGVVHVLAISGLHVGFILAALFMITGFLPLKPLLRHFLIFSGLFLFVALVNFKAPVVRASVMALFYFGARLLQRRPSPLNALGAAAFVLLLADPAQLLKPGFQFSFAAVGGILSGYPRLRQFLPLGWPFDRGKRIVQKFLWQPLLVSLSAIIATIPLTWWYYGSVPVAAVIANLFVIPAIGVVVNLALLFVFSAILHLPFVSGLAVLLQFLLEQTLRVVSAFSSQWWVQWQTGKPAFVPWFIFTLFVILILSGKIKRKHLLFAGIGVLVFVLFFPSSKRLRVTFLDVGQGDACLLEFPQGVTMLVDGGEGGKYFDAGRRAVLPVLRTYGIKRLNYVVATHPHTDHFGGLLSVLKSIAVDTLVLTPYPDSGKFYLRLKEVATRRGIGLRFVRRGKQLKVGDEARCYVLHPFGPFCEFKNHSGHEVNNTSLVLKIQFGKTAVLLTGDLQNDAEFYLARYQKFLKAQILKVAHHGSITSSDSLFLSYVVPRFAVVSVGARNRFNHPSLWVVRQLRVFGTGVWRTDHLGAAVFESDGQRFRLINWRRKLN